MSSIVTSNIETLITDGKDILIDTEKLIHDFNDALDSRGESASKYIDEYDKYSENIYYDATILKKRMKEAVIKAVSDEF